MKWFEDNNFFFSELSMSSENDHEKENYEIHSELNVLFLSTMILSNK